MFRNYLSYQFALNFDQECRTLLMPPQARERLLRSSTQMVHHFAKSLHAKDVKEISRFLCVSLINLRDCREIIDEIGVISDSIEARFNVLHSRLEQLCLKAAEAEEGQLRMFG
jgi:hypothetical protein